MSHVRYGQVNLSSSSHHLQQNCAVCLIRKICVVGYGFTTRSIHNLPFNFATPLWQLSACQQFSCLQKVRCHGSSTQNIYQHLLQGNCSCEILNPPGLGKARILEVWLLCHLQKCFCPRQISTHLQLPKIDSAALEVWILLFEFFFRYFFESTRSTTNSAPTHGSFQVFPIQKEIAILHSTLLVCCFELLSPAIHHSFP